MDNQRFHHVQKTYRDILEGLAQAAVKHQVSFAIASIQGHESLPEGYLSRIFVYTDGKYNAQLNLRDASNYILRGSIYEDYHVFDLPITLVEALGYGEES